MKQTTALALAALLLATGCTKVASTAGGGGEATPAAQGGRHPYTIPHVLRYATAEDIVGLNPHLVQQTVLGYMASLTMAWLVKYDRRNLTGARARDASCPRKRTAASARTA